MAGKNNAVAQYLWGAREAKAEVRRRRLRVHELEARCTSITAKMNGMPGGGGDRHSLEQAYILLAEEREAELAAIREEMRKYHEIEDVINSLPKPEHRAILRLRYLRGLKWDSVQRELERENLFYCGRHAYRLRDDALEEVARVLREGGVAFEVPAETAPELLH